MSELTATNLPFGLIATRISIYQHSLQILSEKQFLSKSFSAVIAKGVRPFPFRTRKQSPSAPMVLPSLGVGE